ncbi:uncharacterized protein LOC132931411 [Rhopalosiphum padi]|nr:uncharacterized protein LOC132931411 [Rhopalosiphum padi]
MQFQSECRRGYKSVFIFKCKMCCKSSSITTEKDVPENNYLPINKAVVSGSLSIGIGFTQLNELSASLEIPCLSATSFSKYQVKVGNAVQDTAWDEMIKAGNEERQLALECGNTDVDGTPMCTVVADGQWSKRSYKTKYDALSGAATIIGYKTGKVLFVGIKNRYCAVCQRSKSLSQEIPKHNCFLNWKQASTAMEAGGIVEGFSKSVEMHGLKFNKLIGDGDSSVVKRLNEILPYGPRFMIQKIECRNHLLRNYISKLKMLATKTEYPVTIRKFIVTNILRFRSDVTKAISYQKDILDKSKNQKIADLKNDLKNAPYHRFGQHQECNSYFCKGSKIGEINMVPEALRCGILLEIDKITSRLVNNSSSLIEDLDNNICEQFNSIINKYVGGKRINFSQSNNYSTRIKAAIISFNSKAYLSTIHKKIMNFSPGTIGKKFMKNTDRIRLNTINRRKLYNSKKIHRKKMVSARSKGPDSHYGLAEPLMDTLDEDELRKKKNSFIQYLHTVDLKKIEIDTRDQNLNPNWFQERKIRLTASRFGEICKMRPNTSCKTKVHNILYKPPVTSKQMSYGHNMEHEARKKLEEIIKLDVQLSGLVIDTNFPYLAASPDGLVGDHAIVEIKCPYTAKDSENSVDAVNNKLLSYCNITQENKLQLKNDHQYYYQVMGQLHITRRNVCYFVVYAKKWISVEHIYYDKTFWEEKMIKKLNLFYTECILPEIVDPLYGKRLLISDIREPTYIKEKINERLTIK